MNIRKADAGDVPHVLVMARDFCLSPIYAGLVAYNPGHLELLADWLINEQLLLVAERSNGAVVGMIGMAICPSTLSNELTACEIAWWVEPGARKGTTALRLWQRAEDWAAERGAVWVQMISPGCDLEVAGMYQRRGYQLLETIWLKRIGE